MPAFLTENAVIETAITPTAGAAGTSDINGSITDLGACDGLLVLVRMGAITSTAVTSIKLQQGDASNLSDAEDVAGSAITVADDDDDETFVIDVQRLEKRYARVVVDRGTANAVVASANYVKYNQHTQVPVTHGSGVTVEKHAAPVGGTA